MDAARSEVRKQWGQLLALTTAHFVLDAFPGLMHTVLPAIQESFKMSVAAGGVLLTVFLIVANGIQVLIGHWRAEKDRPLLLYLGMLLVCAILLFALVSPERTPLLWLSVIAVVCGAGVGMTHPEGLRAIHNLDHIPSTVSSSVFMAGGVIGFAVSGYTTAMLFERWGFMSLIPVCAASVLALGVMLAFRIRLAVERDEVTRKARHVTQPVSFWMIMAIATLAACSATLLGWLIPQRLSELGADLSHGGLGLSMFSLAGGLGGMVMARLAGRRGELATIRWMLAAGIPFIIAYLFLLEHRWAVGLIFAGGFFCFGAYPIMVSVARHCDGPGLGRRMGLIVGGIWLAACILPMILGPAVKALGTGPVILCSPIGFMSALALAYISKIRNRCKSPKNLKSCHSGLEPESRAFSPDSALSRE